MARRHRKKAGRSGEGKEEKERAAEDGKLDPRRDRFSLRAKTGWKQRGSQSGVMSQERKEEAGCQRILGLSCVNCCSRVAAGSSSGKILSLRLWPAPSSVSIPAATTPYFEASPDGDCFNEVAREREGVDALLISSTKTVKALPARCGKARKAPSRPPRRPPHSYLVIYRACVSFALASPTYPPRSPLGRCGRGWCKRRLANRRKVRTTWLRGSTPSVPS